MPDSTTSVTDLINTLRQCLKDNDSDAASFLRDGVMEKVKLHNSWLTEGEQELMASF